MSAEWSGLHRWLTIARIPAQRSELASSGFPTLQLELTSAPSLAFRTPKNIPEARDIAMRRHRDKITLQLRHKKPRLRGRLNRSCAQRPVVIRVNEGPARTPPTVPAKLPCSSSSDSSMESFSSFFSHCSRKKRWGFDPEPATRILRSAQARPTTPSRPR